MHNFLRMKSFFDKVRTGIRRFVRIVVAGVALFSVVFLYHTQFEPFRNRYPEYFSWLPSYDVEEKVTVIEKKEQTTVTESDFVPKLIVNTQNVGVSVVSKGSRGSFQAHGFFVTNDGVVAVPLKEVDLEKNVQYTVFPLEGGEIAATLIGSDPFTETVFLQTNKGGATTLTPAPEDAFFAGRNLLLIGKSFEGNEPVAQVTSLMEWGSTTNMASQLVGSSEKYEGVGRIRRESVESDAGLAATTYQGELLGMTHVRTVGNDAETVIVPIRAIMGALETMRSEGDSWARGVLGVSYVSITPELADAYSLSSDHGAWLSVPGSSASVVLFGSPAAAAGLRQGDSIVSVNGSDVTLDHPLSNTLAQFHPGEKVTLGVMHDDVRRDVSVVLGK